MQERKTIVFQKNATWKSLIPVNSRIMFQGQLWSYGKHIEVQLCFVIVFSLMKTTYLFAFVGNGGVYQAARFFEIPFVFILGLNFL